MLVDDPDVAGALGYHELSSQGTPLGKVFAKLDLDNRQLWTVTLSHELLEMLADPWINWCAVGEDGRVYALEVADAVEADEIGYSIDGVMVSDFVTPGWFEPTENDRVDFKQRIENRLQLAPGGYISVLDPKQGWVQVTAEKPITGGTLPQTMEKVSVANLIPAGSRRHRRTIPKTEWRRSTR